MRILITNLKNGLTKFVRGIDSYTSEVFWTYVESEAHVFEPAVARSFADGRLLKPYNARVQ